MELFYEDKVFDLKAIVKYLEGIAILQTCIFASFAKTSSSYLPLLGVPIEDQQFFFNNQLISNKTRFSDFVRDNSSTWEIYESRKGIFKEN